MAAECPAGPVKETVDKRRHLLFQASAPKKLSTAAFVIERERVPGQDLYPVEPHNINPAKEQTVTYFFRKGDGTGLPDGFPVPVLI